MDEKYNYLGDLISGIREIKNESFIKRDAYGKKQINSLGEYIPNWTPPNEYVDENGFDKEYKGTHGYWDEIILPV